MNIFQVIRHSLRTKLWVLTSLLIVFTIVGVTSVSSRITTNFVTDETKRDLSGNTRIYLERINLICNETAVFTKMAISNKEIQDFSREVDDWSFSSDQEIKRFLVDFVIPRTFIEGMNLFYISSNANFSSSHYLERSPLFQNKENLLFNKLIPSHREIWGMPFYSEQTQHYLLPYYRKIYYGKSGRELGMIESLVPVELFEISIDNSIFSDEASLYIINSEGRIIVHNDKDKILTEIDGKKLDFLKQNLNNTSLFDDSILCHTQVVPRTDWIIVNEVSRSVLLSPARKMGMDFLLIGFIALIFAVMISFELSGSITKPVIDMEKSISMMENLESKKYVQIHAKDEIGRLGKQYNRMIDRIAQAAEFERKRDVKIKEYELALLQSQINPHFLNNILENICGLIELERKEDSLSLIRDTADFYRSILSIDSLVITLEQELRILNLYIKIQNVRCNNKIIPEIDIPDIYLEKQIVKLTLQPLVENAIRHGMDLFENPIHIKIDSIVMDDLLIIRIIDSGVGMRQDVVDGILKTERKTGDGKTRHIGVYATDQRLKLHFGSKYGLKYLSEEGRGTIVEIHLPRNKQNDEIR